MEWLALTAALAVCALSTVVAEAAPQRTVRIALLSDTHVRTNPTGDHAAYRDRLLQAVAQVREMKPDVTLFAGDLTENGSPEDFLTFKALAAGLRKPVLWVAGNHDVGGKRLPGKAEGVTEESMAAFEAALGPGFGARTAGGARIITLNASLLGSGLPSEARQWALLERETARKGATPKVILLHNPLFVKEPGEKGGDYWCVEPEPRKRLLDLARRGGVRAILSGHIHRPLEAEAEGIACITTPPVSFGLPPGAQPEGWTWIEIDPAGAVTARVVEIR
ncbi:MAG: metallophosphoesterase [Armatimonadetes bacterium]|nr:metallophosphoesterase [Armatimonadota bacterium]